MNKLTKPPREVHSIHYLLHTLTGLLVFAAGIGADVGIVHWLHVKPHAVNWQSGASEIGYVNRKVEKLPLGPIEFGIMDNGAVVWREKTNASAAK